MSCFNVRVVSVSGMLPLYQLNCVIKSSQIILNTTEAQNMTSVSGHFLSVIGLKVSKGNRYIYPRNKQNVSSSAYTVAQQC